MDIKYIKIGIFSEQKTLNKTLMTAVVIQIVTSLFKCLNRQ
jgi:hypothetical protein